MGTAIKHPLPDRVKPSFVIFDIQALWRSTLSVRVPGCQKLQVKKKEEVRKRRSFEIKLTCQQHTATSRATTHTLLLELNWETFLKAPSGESQYIITTSLLPAPQRTCYMLCWLSHDESCQRHGGHNDHVTSSLPAGDCWCRVHQVALWLRRRQRSLWLQTWWSKGVQCQAQLTGQVRPGSQRCKGRQRVEHLVNDIGQSVR